MVFSVDAESAGVVEGDVESFGALNDNFAELFFLGEGDGLKLNHFEDGQERDDHGVTRGTAFEELDKADRIGVARQNLATKLSDHLGDGERFVLEFDPGYFPFAFQDLLKNTDEIDE